LKAQRIFHFPFFISQFSICHFPFVIFHLSFSICHFPFVIFHLSFVIGSGYATGNIK